MFETTNLFILNGREQFHCREIDKIQQDHLYNFQNIEVKLDDEDKTLILSACRDAPYEGYFGGTITLVKVLQSGYL